MWVFTLQLEVSDTNTVLLISNSVVNCLVNHDHIQICQVMLVLHVQTIKFDALPWLNFTLKPLDSQFKNASVKPCLILQTAARNT